MWELQFVAEHDKQKPLNTPHRDKQMQFSTDTFGERIA